MTRSLPCKLEKQKPDVRPTALVECAVTGKGGSRSLMAYACTIVSQIQWRMLAKWAAKPLFRPSMSTKENKKNRTSEKQPSQKRYMNHANHIQEIQSHLLRVRRPKHHLVLV